MPELLVSASEFDSSEDQWIQRFFLAVNMDLGARKSGQFDFLQDLRFFKHLYLFYEKELEEFPTGEYEYLGEMQNFSAAPQ